MFAICPCCFDVLDHCTRHNESCGWCAGCEEACDIPEPPDYFEYGDCGGDCLYCSGAGCDACDYANNYDSTSGFNHTGEDISYDEDGDYMGYYEDGDDCMYCSGAGCDVCDYGLTTGFQYLGGGDD